MLKLEEGMLDRGEQDLKERLPSRFEEQPGGVRINDDRSTHSLQIGKHS